MTSAGRGGLRVDVGWMLLGTGEETMLPAPGRSSMETAVALRLHFTVVSSERMGRGRHGPIARCRTVRYPALEDQYRFCGVD